MANVELGEYEWLNTLIESGAGVVKGVVSDVNKTKQTKITTDSQNYIASLGAGVQNTVSNLPPYVMPLAIGAAVLLVGGFVLTRKKK